MGLCMVLGYSQVNDGGLVFQQAGCLGGELANLTAGGPAAESAPPQISGPGFAARPHVTIPPSGGPAPDRATNLLIALLLLALVIGLQMRAGANHAEFGGHPDEAAHYVTGLMLRDYVASGLPGNPMAYAKTYYDHYPKVAIGNWPPGFYAIQTV